MLDLVIGDRSVATKLVYDTQYTNNLNSITWGNPISQIPITAEIESPWHFSSRNKFWCFLQFE